MHQKADFPQNRWEIIEKKLKDLFYKRLLKKYIYFEHSEDNIAAFISIQLVFPLKPPCKEASSNSKMKFLVRKKLSTNGNYASNSLCCFFFFSQIINQINGTGFWAKEVSVSLSKRVRSPTMRKVIIKMTIF